MRVPQNKIELFISPVLRRAPPNHRMRGIEIRGKISNLTISEADPPKTRIRVLGRIMFAKSVSLYQAFNRFEKGGVIAINNERYYKIL